MSSVPNWQHHSGKDRKGKRKPRLIQQRKDALKFLKRKLNATHYPQN